MSHGSSFGEEAPVVLEPAALEHLSCAARRGEHISHPLVAMPEAHEAKKDFYRLNDLMGVF